MRKLLGVPLFMCASASLAVVSTIWLQRPNLNIYSSSPHRRRLRSSSGVLRKSMFKRDPQTVEVKKDIMDYKDNGGTPPHLAPLPVCGRLAPIPHEIDMQIMQKYATCPLLSNPPENTNLLLLEGIGTFGRLGNNLIEFLHSLQYAKDNGMVLGIMHGSWPTHLITDMWMAIQDDASHSRHTAERTRVINEWIISVEKAFCVKIIVNVEDLDQYKEVIRFDTKQAFLFQHNYHDGDLNEYIEFQSNIIRTLFRSYNKGVGVTMRNKPVNDMCSVMDAMFGSERHSAVYSVIHSRSLEGEPGIRLLGRIAEKSKCDPMAALDMEPEYVKAILKPLEMLDHPIIFITDQQRPEILEKLLADPDIGPNIRLIPQEASWVGGDITVALMSNVFIGNPASTFSGFIAKSRVALGYTATFMFRRKNLMGQWNDVCDHRCIFDKKVMSAMA